MCLQLNSSSAPNACTSHHLSKRQQVVRLRDVRPSLTPLLLSRTVSRSIQQEVLVAPPSKMGSRVTHFSPWTAPSQAQPPSLLLGSSLQPLPWSLYPPLPPVLPPTACPPHAVRGTLEHPGQIMPWPCPEPCCGSTSHQGKDKALPPGKGQSPPGGPQMPTWPSCHLLTSSPLSFSTTVLRAHSDPAI